MPNIDVISPVSSAPIDRLALGLGWVRPGAAHIGGSLSLSSPGVAGIGLKGGGGGGYMCFEGYEE